MSQSIMITRGWYKMTQKLKFMNFGQFVVWKDIFTNWRAATNFHEFWCSSWRLANSCLNGSEQFNLLLCVLHKKQLLAVSKGWNVWETFYLLFSACWEKSQPAESRWNPSQIFHPAFCSKAKGEGGQKNLGWRRSNKSFSLQASLQW